LSAYRLGSAAFILVLAVAGSQLPSVGLMGLVAVACIIQVVLDLLGTRPPIEVESEMPQE
jgi:hypothetical protein